MRQNLSIPSIGSVRSICMVKLEFHHSNSVALSIVPKLELLIKNSKFLIHSARYFYISLTLNGLTLINDEVKINKSTSQTETRILIKLKKKKKKIQIRTSNHSSMFHVSCPFQPQQHYSMKHCCGWNNLIPICRRQFMSVIWTNAMQFNWDVWSWHLI